MSVNQQGMKLYWGNGVYLGDVIADVDGYYKFWPEVRGGGYWDEHILFAVGNRLKELNKECDMQVRSDFKISGCLCETSGMAMQGKVHIDCPKHGENSGFENND